MNEDLEKKLELARDHVRKMSPQKLGKMLKQQAEAWAKAETPWAKDFREGKCKRD